ncbi:hypothetical protein FH972_009638 [Carpinus fangiana]|uniref:KIB1-4 beta-propeller domain-containing protein n=1 Tax=Carpinus fangiana TaxID=176857 RepID=A0A660KMV4_9ROSI|nr:hypothetical protein FH972_009638 [Carpinus fangiana]
MSTSTDHKDVSSPSPWLTEYFSYFPTNLSFIKLGVAGLEMVTLKYRSGSDLGFAGTECLGSSSPGWLAFISPDLGTITLVNPFTQKSTDNHYHATPPLVKLPPATTLPDANVLVKRGWAIEERYSMGEYFSGFVHNIVWSSNPMSPDCTVMVIYGPYGMVAFCRPGDKSWSTYPLYRDGGCMQLAYSNKKKLFYARGGERNAFDCWDLRNPSCPKMVHRFYHPSCHATYEECTELGYGLILEYLVESLGDILLVVRYIGLHTPPIKTLRFDVFKVDPEHEKLVTKVECLGDRVLFLGQKQSFSVSARDFPELKPNSIYFTHDQEYSPGEYEVLVMDRYIHEHEIHSQKLFDKTHKYDFDAGIYSLEDASITALALGDKKDDIHLYPPGSWVIPFPHA